jgi:hypothetical protein
MTLPSEPLELSAAVERIRASGVLGEARLRRLFDYLVDTSLAGKSPKEIAIAIDVFDKNANYDVSQDALVRVYIHKLRKALESFHDDPANKTVANVQIPRGEYRLVVLPVPEAAVDAQAGPEVAAAPDPNIQAIVPPLPMQPPFRRHSARLPWLLCAVLGLCLTVSSVYIFWPPPKPGYLDKVRADSIWSTLLADDRPLMIVVGDYYLIGESDSSMEIKRLVREYSVNSPNDLDNFLKLHPEDAERYMDVGLRYVPTSTAYALADVMPVLNSGKHRVMIATMSEVSASTLKTHNIVYIGYLSGLGNLGELVFAGSHFAIGDSYDEVRDKSSNRLYISQTASENRGELKRFGESAPYRDYGFFSTFRGPGGNYIVVIAGTRDEGVRQTAEVFTNPEKLKEIPRQGAAGTSFDALLEVSALDGVNLTGKLLVESKRDVVR